MEISNRLVDRLRGKYASGPHLPNGRPEFGWRQFEAPPIQHEAADRIEKLEATLLAIGKGMVPGFEDELGEDDAAAVSILQRYARESLGN